MNADFVFAVKSAIESALVARGFQRLRRHEVALDISGDFLGWLGLNTGNYKTHVRINPFVGVHCLPMMRLIAGLEGDKYKVGNIATYAVHLGELCPTIKVFEFYPELDVPREASRLATSVIEHGVPYMRSLASIEALLPLLKSRVHLLGGFPEKYAVALRLSGHDADARAFVLQCQQEYATKSTTVRNSFDRFAIPFLENPH
jgi:hypothetical protein